MVNVSLGISSFGVNVSRGNVAGAFVDAGGILLDSAATATPYVPAFAGFTIKATRTVKALPAGEALKISRMVDEIMDSGKIGQSKVSKIPGMPAKSTPVGELRSAGLKDAHHVIQDAAVRELPGYSTQNAPGVQLTGPSTAPGPPHYDATQVQRQAGGGTYGAERRIGYKSLRRAGYSEGNARQIITEADAYFENIGVTRSTPTRIPGNR